MIKAIMPVYKAGTTLSDGNTIIDSSLMKQMVDEFNEKLKNEQINHYYYGTINGNSFPNVNLEDITHKINNAYIKDNSIMADIDILDTPKGKIVQTMLENGKKIQPSLDLIKCDNDKIYIHSISINYDN